MTKSQIYDITYTLGAEYPYRVSCTTSRGESRYFKSRAEAIIYVTRIIAEVTP